MEGWLANADPVTLEPAERVALEPALIDGTLIQVEKGVRFADEGMLVTFACEFVLEHEASHLLSGAKACFQRLAELWGNDIGKPSTLCGCILGALHNSGRFDAWAWARQAVQEGMRSYDVLYVLEVSLTRFERAQAASVFQFFVEPYGKPITAGSIYAPLQEWLGEHAAVATGIKDLHEAAPKDASWSLYACVLHALAAHDFASGIQGILASAQSATTSLSGPAVHVLGLLAYADPERRAALGEAIRICAAIVRGADHPLTETAVEALGRLAAYDEDSVIPILDEAGRTQRPSVLGPLSIFIFRNERAHGSKAWFWPLVMHLTAARDVDEGRFGHVDMMLSNWIRDDARASRALEFLNSWVANQPIEALAKKGIEGAFPTTLHRFVEHPAAFGSALVQWFLHDDTRFPLVAQKIIAHLRIAKVSNLAFDPETLDGLNPAELKLLTRRFLGYVSGEDILLSLTFSLLRTNDAKERTAGLVAFVLLDRVGYDYPGYTIDFLKGRLAATEESGEVKSFCAQIASKLEARLAALEALPNLKEFHPPSSKVLRFEKERHRKINEAFEEASKNSILRQIATEIRLKGGLRTFQHFQDHYTAPMELKPHSQTMALPRSETSDPLGAARERLQFRRATKDTP